MLGGTIKYPWPGVLPDQGENSADGGELGLDLGVEIDPG